MVTARRASFWGLMFCVLILLPGCVQQFRYEPKPLPILNSYNASFEDIQQSVSLFARKLSYHDGKDLFNGNGKYLYNGGTLVPVQLTIENNSSFAWTLSPNHIEIEQAPFYVVRKQVSNNTAARIATIAILGTLFSIPAIVIGAIAVPTGVILGSGLLILSSVSIGTGIATGTAATSVAVYEGYRSAAQNVSIEEDIHRISLLNEITIQPGKKISKLIFIPQKQFLSSFNIEFTNAANELDQLKFDCNLEQKTNTQ